MRKFKLRKWDYNLETSVLLYEQLKQASLLTEKGYEPYFNHKDIKYPTQFNTRIKMAKQAYIQNLKQAAFYAKEKDVWLYKLAKIVYKHSIENGGATIFPGTGLALKGGYAVGGVADTVHVANLTYKDVLEYIKSHVEYFEKDNYMVGTWYDPELKHWDLDVTEVIVPETNEKEAQELTQMRGERAYFDLYNFETKKADGTLYQP